MKGRLKKSGKKSDHGQEASGTISGAGLRELGLPGGGGGKGREEELALNTLIGGLGRDQ